MDSDAGRKLTWHDLDEDDVRIRPNPKGSRPRTKRRPTFEDAPLGMVLEVHLRRYRVLTDSGVEILATLAKELRHDGCVTGDRVALDGDVSGEKGSLARIVRVEERSSVLTRAAEDGEELEQTIVANADQMVIVMAAANPEPRPRLVDRYLVAAINSGIRPLLVITKSDLADPQQLAQQFADVDLTVIATRSDKPELDALVAELSGHVSVFVGHSGVGKSTLINLLTGEGRSTGGVNSLTGKGKHTSSSAVALRFDGGWIIDTPGIRSFGISAIGAEDILKGFPDLATAAQDCPRGCSHLVASPDCALDDQVAANSIAASRLDSFRRLLTSVSSVDF